MILEICVESFESARLALEAGADRIELCSALDLGGLSPSGGLLKMIKSRLSITTHVLIRPRGGDFCYDDHEYATMLEDIHFAKELGAEAVVLGILTPVGDIDIARTKALVDEARPMSVTFHRAFDYVRDMNSALEDVIKTGAARILTSGGKQKALQGLPKITELNNLAQGRIIIMPGSGINRHNAKTIANTAGVQELHFSASQKTTGMMKYKNLELSLSESGDGDYLLRKTDFEEIKTIRELFT